jgi:nucleolar protein 56
MTRTLVSTWYGTFLLDAERVVREQRAPLETEALANRALKRREGRHTPEDEAVLAERGEETWRTGDRRLVGPGVEYDPDSPRTVPIATDPAILRAATLLAAEQSLTAAWDPSIHLEEAVRAARDLDRAANLVGERLATWAAHDFPDVDPTDGGRAARAVLEGDGVAALAPTEPGLIEARHRLAGLYRMIGETRSALDAAVAAAVPLKTPNLSELLGADLAARMLAQAGGLDRLARLPASTVQVLGAERAFFEHLRGRAPPPRHGLLFVHPSIQSAPRTERGRLARSLAAKVAIAARLDQAGTPLDPSLKAAFERRRAALRERRSADPRRRERRRSRAPLDRAPSDR